MFGFFPTLVYKKILQKSPFVDSIAVGEFEHTLPELAICLEKGKPLNLVKGLAMRSTLENARQISRLPEKNPDRFAFPERAHFDGSATILASRGCYNHCSFCPIPTFYNQGTMWRGRTPENIRIEMESLIQKGVKEFYFVDPNFVGPGRAGKKRTLELLKHIAPLNITFGMETRSDDLDDELLEKLVQAGLTTLLLGVESGSTSVLTAIDKSSDASGSKKAIQLCRKYGVEPEIGFLMFTPDNTLFDLKENMAFLQENNLLDRLDRTANLLCHSQIVLAGTTGYKRFEKMNRLQKTGIFEFEAEVMFSDPKVDQVSESVMFACHTILKSMSDKKSPIFWKNSVTPVFKAANDYLVDLFHSLVSQAQTREDRIQEIKHQITMDIHSILTMDGVPPSAE